MQRGEARAGKLRCGAAPFSSPSGASQPAKSPWGGGLAIKQPWRSSGWVARMRLLPAALALLLLLSSSVPVGGEWLWVSIHVPLPTPGQWHWVSQMGLSVGSAKLSVLFLAFELEFVF